MQVEPRFVGRVRTGLLVLAAGYVLGPLVSSGLDAWFRDALWGGHGEAPTLSLETYLSVSFLTWQLVALTVLGGAALVAHGARALAVRGAAPLAVSAGLYTVEVVGRAIAHVALDPEGGTSPLLAALHHGVDLAEIGAVCALALGLAQLLPAVGGARLVLWPVVAVGVRLFASALGLYVSGRSVEAHLASPRLLDVYQAVSWGAFLSIALLALSAWQALGHAGAHPDAAWRVDPAWGQVRSGLLSLRTAAVLRLAVALLGGVGARIALASEAAGLAHSLAVVGALVALACAVLTLAGLVRLSAAPHAGAPARSAAALVVLAAPVDVYAAWGMLRVLEAAKNPYGVTSIFEIVELAESLPFVGAIGGALGLAASWLLFGALSAVARGRNLADVGHLADGTRVLLLVAGVPAIGAQLAASTGGRPAVPVALLLVVALAALLVAFVVVLRFFGITARLLADLGRAEAREGEEPPASPAPADVDVAPAEAPESTETTEPTPESDREPR